MLVNIFELPRDAAPDDEAFANIGQLNTEILHPVVEGYNYHKPLWEVEATPMVGGELYLAGRPWATKPLPLVKACELYRGPEGEPVVLERVGYNANGMLYFYKTRCRTPTTRTSFVTPCHLPPIHAHIANTQPREWAIGDARWTPISTVMQFCDHPKVVNVFQRVCELLAAELPKVEDLLAPDAVTQEPVEAAMISFFSDLLNPTTALHTDKEMIELLSRHLRTDIPAVDPLTGALQFRGVSRNELRHYLCEPAGIDTSVPAPLVMNDPYTHTWYDRDNGPLAEAIDQVPLTDFSVSYQLTPDMRPYNRQIDHLTDRYAGVMEAYADPDVILAKLDHAAMLAGRSLRRVYTIGHKLWTPTILRLTKTNAEEAMVEALDNNERCYAIHLDLALLSMCSLGVTTGDETTLC